MRYVDLRYINPALKLWRQKSTQALLSSLGIIVGVSGLVMVIALGEGAASELESALGTMGAGSVVVRQTHEGANILSHRRVNSAERLLKNHIQYLTTAVRKNHLVSSTEYAISKATVIAITREHSDLYKLEMRKGRFINDLDIKNQQRVCILGKEIGRQLFPRGQIIGQEIRIGQNWFRVVGWLQAMSARMPKLDDLNFSNIDYEIYIPAQSRKGSSRYESVDEIVIQFKNEDAMVTSLETLKRILSWNQNDNTLEYIIPIELLRQKQNLQRIFQYLLLAIAALMLIVGGVGIMNMMMVNVISRQSEIGLRRAIGATTTDIVTQFVTESSVISLAGGLAGVLLGFLISTFVNEFTQTTMLFNSTAAFMGFSSSVIIGVVFGSYPALQAASVSPIQALNEL